LWCIHQVSSTFGNPAKPTARDLTEHAKLRKEAEVVAPESIITGQAEEMVSQFVSEQANHLPRSAHSSALRFRSPSIRSVGAFVFKQPAMCTALVVFAVPPLYETRVMIICQIVNCYNSVIAKL
jgi:hypothetical protein